MSLYDTEDLMQTGALLLGTSSMFLNIKEIGPSAIKAACKVVEQEEPQHYQTAEFYCKKGGNSLKVRMDKILGVDDVLEIETEDGELVRVAVDWTDNLGELVRKSDRFKTRPKMLETLGCQKALAVCVSNQIRLGGDRDKAKFMYQALFLIMERVESMTKKTGYLDINMKAIMSK